MPKPRYILTLVYLLAATIHPDAAYSGFPAGPFLVWVDLRKDVSPHISEKVVTYVKNEKNGLLCGRNVNNPILYVKARPEGVSDQLVIDALIKNDHAAIASLREKLLAFRDPPDVIEGLDGVIAYSEIDGPKMLGLGAKTGRTRISTIKRTTDSNEVVESFCAVVPPSWRKVVGQSTRFLTATRNLPQPHLRGRRRRFPSSTGRNSITN